MDDFEVPEDLHALAVDRGYAVDLTAYAEPDGTPRPVWLLYDLPGAHFVVDSVTWRTADEVEAYIRDAS